MSTTDVRHTIYAHLADMGGGVPIQSAYKTGERVTPRYEVAIVGEYNTTPTLDGGGFIMGEIAITAVVGADTGETEFAPLVDAIQDHFSPATPVDGIAIIGRPVAQAPYVDGAELRVPIFVRFKALLSA